MRKVAPVIAAMLFTAITPANSVTNIKAGATCSKLNQVQIVKNIKFQCIKSGKKLIWKSTSIAKPDSASTPNQKPAVIDAPKPAQNNEQIINSEPTSGSTCQNIGTRIPKSSDSYLECRMVSGGNLKYFNIQTGIATPVNLASLGNIKDCQVPDQTNRDPGATPIGYKTNRYQNPSYPTEGKFKIVIIPVDFNDVPGQNLDLNLLENSARKVEKWFEYESNGKLNVSVTYLTKWLRAPKNSQSYNWNHPGTQNPTTLTDNQIGQDYVDISDALVDFSNVGAIFVIHPDRIKTIEYGMMAATRVHTNEGEISPFLVSNGFQVDRQDGAMWAYWIHEFMHHVGLTGHAPDELWNLDLMDLQSGYGLTTTTWNQLLIDWLLPSQVYCRNISDLLSDQISLTSVDSLSNGVKSIMIAMSNHEVLVIESRRKDYWTSSATTLMYKEVYDGFYGVTAYVVDTRIQNNNEIDKNSPGYDVTKNKFAYYLRISSNSLTEFKGVSGLEYIMLEGGTLTFRNVKISLMSSGNFDTVKVEKI